MSLREIELPKTGPSTGWQTPALLMFAGFVVLFWLDLRQSLLGALLAPAIGVPGESGWFGRAACSFLAIAIVALYVVAVRRLPAFLRTPAVWLALAVLFLYFFASFGLDYGFIERKLPFLLAQGAVTTIFISLVSIALASVIALFAALGKLSGDPVIYGVSSFYISFFRGLPLLMQIYLIYLGLPQIGFVIDAVPAGITALSLCYGAYMAEIFRAGILGVGRGQHEAAAALGLSPGLTFRKIVFPQAMRLIIPPTGNQFIAMLKDSSLVSVVGVWELTFLARTQGKSEFKHVEMLITAAIIYWLMSMAFELIQSRIEKHYGKGVSR